MRQAHAPGRGVGRLSVGGRLQQAVDPSLVRMQVPQIVIAQGDHTHGRPAQHKGQDGPSYPAPGQKNSARHHKRRPSDGAGEGKCPGVQRGNPPLIPFLFHGKHSKSKADFTLPGPAPRAARLPFPHLFFRSISPPRRAKPGSSPLFRAPACGRPRHESPRPAPAGSPRSWGSRSAARRLHGS